MSQYERRYDPRTEHIVVFSSNSAVRHERAIPVGEWTRDCRHYDPQSNEVVMPPEDDKSLRIPSGPWQLATWMDPLGRWRMGYSRETYDGDERFIEFAIWNTRTMGIASFWDFTDVGVVMLD